MSEESILNDRSVMQCGDSMHTIAKLSARISELEKRCALYQTAINKIDDYFEYGYKSKEDQSVVYGVLGTLTAQLKRGR